MSTIYGVAELARATGISADAIRQRAHRGAIPAPAETLECGRVWQGEAIERWIEQHRAKGEQGS